MTVNGWGLDREVDGVGSRCERREGLCDVSLRSTPSTAVGLILKRPSAHVDNTCASGRSISPAALFWLTSSSAEPAPEDDDGNRPHGFPPLARRVEHRTPAASTKVGGSWDAGQAVLCSSLTRTSVDADSTARYSRRTSASSSPRSSTVRVGSSFLRRGSIAEVTPC